MSVIQQLSTLVLQPLLGGLLESQGLTAGDRAAERVTRFFAERLGDPSRRLTRAIQTSSERAWQALEMALEGETFWRRLLSRGEDLAFRQQVRLFLDSAPLPQLAGKEQFRASCVAELKQARRRGLLGGEVDAKQVAGQLGTLARFGDPQRLLQAEQSHLAGITEHLRQAGLQNLAEFLSLPAEGTPLLLVAVRYFFRRAVEEDPALFQGLAFCQLDSLVRGQTQGFQALHEALSRHGDELLAALDDVRKAVAQTHSAVLDLQEEMRRLSGQQAEMHRQVLRLLERVALKDRPLAPHDSFSLRNVEEVRQVQGLLQAFRQAPEETRRHYPALTNGLGKVLVATGGVAEAVPLFEALAQAVEEPAAQAEALLNAYHAAIECRDWGRALKALRAADRAGGRRLAPIPLDRYEPEAILGAGGFGVVFRCRNRHSDAVVAVKALRIDGLERDARAVFREANVLQGLRHDSIIRLLDCGFVEGETRPYLVLEYFDGLTLEELVRKNGPLPLADVLHIARQMAEGLAAAHERNILHRDVKPGNVLVRETDEGWEVKLIDFGLALRKQIVQTTVANASAMANTILGGSIAGTIDYAAPEQMGKAPRVAVGPHSDIFSFGRTLCYLIFGTPTPGPRQWKSLEHEELSELLADCLNEDVSQRPASFREVAERLKSPQDSFVQTTETTAEQSYPTESDQTPSVVEGTTATSSDGKWDGLLGFLVVVGVIFGIKECNSKPNPKPVQMPQQYQPYQQYQPNPYQQYPPAYPPRR